MLARACALTFLLPLLSCGVSTALVKEEAEGRVELKGPAEAVSELTPLRCSSGERALFLGADFISASGVTARVVVDALGGATLRFFDSQERLTPGLLFTRAECEMFHLDLERTGWKVNDVYDLRVRVEFSCRRVSDNAFARGTLSAEHCH